MTNADTRLIRHLESVAELSERWFELKKAGLALESLDATTVESGGGVGSFAVESRAAAKSLDNLCSKRLALLSEFVKKHCDDAAARLEAVVEAIRGNPEAVSEETAEVKRGMNGVFRQIGKWIDQRRSGLGDDEAFPGAAFLRKEIGFGEQGAEGCATAVGELAKLHRRIVPPAEGLLAELRKPGTETQVVWAESRAWHRASAVLACLVDEAALRAESLISSGEATRVDD